MKQHRQKPVIIATLALLMAIIASTPAQATCRSFTGHSYFNQGKLKIGQLSLLYKQATYRSQQKARNYFHSGKPDWRSAKNRRVRKIHKGYSYHYIATATYGGVMSAGTFTHGHVDAGCVNELFRLLKPGGHFVTAIRKTYWQPAGFKAKIEQLTKAGVIRTLSQKDDGNYADSTEAESWFLVWQKI